MTLDYKVKINADTAEFIKKVNECKGKVEKLADDQLFVKLQYDGNYSEFYKVIKDIAASCPEIAVDFQYNLNKAALEHEVKKLESMKVEMDPIELKETILKKLSKYYDDFDDMNKKQLEQAEKEIKILYEKLESQPIKKGSKINASELLDFEDFQDELDHILKKYEDVDLFSEMIEAQERVIKEIEKNMENLGKSVQQALPETQTVKVELDTSLFNEQTKEVKNALDELTKDREIKVIVNSSDTNEELKNISSNDNGQDVINIEKTINVSNFTVDGQQLHESIQDSLYDGGGFYIPVTPAITGLEDAKKEIEDAIGNIDVNVHTDNVTSKEKTNEHYLYHWGNDKGIVADKIEETIPNYYKGKHHHYDAEPYGLFGTGVYTVSDPNAFSKLNPDETGRHTKYLKIDPDKLNLYETKTSEHAQQVMDYLELLQKYCISAATGFDWTENFNPNDYSAEELYKQYKSVFTDTKLSFEQFSRFLLEMDAVIKDQGFDENGNILKPSLARTSGKDSITTRFMKLLGYNGVDNTGTDKDNFVQGSVIYNLPDEAIVKRYETLDELLADINSEQNKFAEQHDATQIDSAIELNKFIVDDQKLHEAIQDSLYDGGGVYIPVIPTFIEIDEQIEKLKNEIQDSLGDIKVNINEESYNSNHAENDDLKYLIAQKDAQIEEMKRNGKALDSIQENEKKTMLDDIAKDLEAEYTEFVESENIEMDAEIGEIFRDKVREIFNILKRHGINIKNSSNSSDFISNQYSNNGNASVRKNEADDLDNIGKIKIELDTEDFEGQLEELKLSIDKSIANIQESINNGNIDKLFKDMAVSIGGVIEKIDELNKKDITGFSDNIKQGFEKISNSLKSVFGSGNKNQMYEVFKQWAEADREMQNKDVELHERGFNADLFTGKIGNPYVYDKEHSIRNSITAIGAKELITDKVHVHSHPDSFSGMSLVQDDYSLDYQNFSGDLLNDINLYFEEGVKYFINTAMEDVSFLNGELFDKYKDIFTKLKDDGFEKARVYEITNKYREKAANDYSLFYNYLRDNSSKNFDDIESQYYDFIKEEFDFGIIDELKESHYIPDFATDIIGKLMKGDVTSTNFEDFNETINEILGVDFGWDSELVKDFNKYVGDAFEWFGIDKSKINDRTLFTYNIQKLLPDFFEEAFGIEDFSKYFETYKIDELDFVNPFGMFNDLNIKNGNPLEALFDTTKIQEFAGYISKILSDLREITTLSFDNVSDIINGNVENAVGNETNNIQALSDKSVETKNIESSIPIGEQINTQNVLDTTDEVNELSRLPEYIDNNIIPAINRKMDAFREEETKLGVNVTSEIEMLQSLLAKIQEIAIAISSLPKIDLGGNKSFKNFSDSIKEFARVLREEDFSHSDFMTVLNNLLGKKDELENLAKILEQSQSKIDKAAEKLNLAEKIKDAQDAVNSNGSSMMSQIEAQINKNPDEKVLGSTIKVTKDGLIEIKTLAEDTVKNIMKLYTSTSQDGANAVITGIIDDQSIIQKDIERYKKYQKWFATFTGQGNAGKPYEIFTPESDGWDDLIAKAKSFGIKVENIEKVTRKVVDDQESFTVSTKNGGNFTIGMSSSDILMQDETPVDVTGTVNEYEKLLKKQQSLLIEIKKNNSETAKLEEKDVDDNIKELEKKLKLYKDKGLLNDAEFKDLTDTKKNAIKNDTKLKLDSMDQSDVEKKQKEVNSEKKEYINLLNEEQRLRIQIEKTNSQDASNELTRVRDKITKQEAKLDQYKTEKRITDAEYQFLTDTKKNAIKKDTDNTIAEIQKKKTDKQQAKNNAQQAQAQKQQNKLQKENSKELENQAKLVANLTKKEAEYQAKLEERNAKDQNKGIGTKDDAEYLKLQQKAQETAKQKAAEKTKLDLLKNKATQNPNNYNNGIVQTVEQIVRDAETEATNIIANAKKVAQVIINSAPTTVDPDSGEGQLTKLEKELNDFIKKPKSGYLSSVDKTAQEYIDTISEIRKAYADLNSKEALDKITKLKQDVYDLQHDPEFKLGKNSTIDKLIAKAEGFKKKYEVTGLESAKIDKLVDKLLEVKNSGENSAKAISDLVGEVHELESELSMSKDWASSFLEIGNRVENLSEQFLAQFLSIQDWISYIQSAVNVVIELDTALTELRKVTDTTEVRLSQSMQNSAETAKQLGATISDVINSTADWARLGYNIDEAEELARISQLYVNVGDDIDMDTATSSMISTLKGYELSVEDAESIVDKFNKIGNNYAITSKEIGDALQNSAASFHTANTDLDESIALITGANEVTQDADAVGNAWKVVSARIRGKIDMPIYN